MKVYDLSPMISSEIAVFPGDQPFERSMAMDFSKGHHLQLSAMKTTVHLGAHADSSGHYHALGQGVEQRPLAHFCGKAQVIEVEKRMGARIDVKQIQNKEVLAPRVLFKTGSFPDPNKWNSDFMSLSSELIEYLAKQGVQLVGIDTPSVDPETSKDLPSHQALFRTKMAVLEGLVLTKVPEGIYTLVAMPLPLKDFDASPVRALLFEDPQLIPDQPWQIIR